VLARLEFEDSELSGCPGCAAQGFAGGAGEHVIGFKVGDVIVLPELDLTCVNTIEVRYGAIVPGAAFEIRTASGGFVASVDELAPTGDWQLHDSATISLGSSIEAESLVLVGVAPADNWIATLDYVDFKHAE
jgi:hypothetical protein